MVPDATLLGDDIRAFGSLAGVHVYDLPAMSPAEVQAVLNGPGTIIGAFCDSGACLAPDGGYEGVMDAEQDQRLREFVGYIWIGDQPGIRLSVWAHSGEEAWAKIVTEYGEGHVISLWNEEDASRPRNLNGPEVPKTAEDELSDG